MIFVRACVKTQAPDPSTAAAMILSTGLSLKKIGKRAKPPLAVTHGAVSGEMVLVARAVAKAAMYFWEHSLDQDTWTSAAQTMKARTAIAGLTPGRVYAFRFRAQTPKGMGEYSDAVRLMVI